MQKGSWMRKLARAVGAAAGMVMAGCLVATAAPASAATKTIESNCVGTAVRACVQVRFSEAHWGYLGWAKITDNQNDAANYDVWVDHLSLERYTTRGWLPSTSSADLDGRYKESETAQTATDEFCPAGDGNVKIRSEAVFHWATAGTNVVHSRVIYSGAKWVPCRGGRLD
jgi:hypothetical protein